MCSNGAALQGERLVCACVLHTNTKRKEQTTNATRNMNEEEQEQEEEEDGSNRPMLLLTTFVCLNKCSFVSLVRCVVE